VYDCANAVTIPSGQITAFSAIDWSNTDGKWCSVDMLWGSVFAYSGGPTPDGGIASSNDKVVDTAAGNIKYSLTASAGGYAGGGISFNRCVNVSAFNALQFTLAVPTGSFAGCDFMVQLQTFEQRPVSQTPGPGGCDPDAGSCYRFPTSTNFSTGSTAPMTLTIPFSMFTTSATQASPFQGQLVGLQFQLQSAAPVDPDGGVQLSCTAELRIDDVKFVTQ
jgi:hypothetical protein